MRDEREQVSSFGAWLRRQRKARDWTQAELAQRVGCTQDTIKKIETEVRRPSKQLAGRIAIALTIPPDEHAAVVQAARGERCVDHLPPPGSTNGEPARAPRQAAAPRHQLRTPLPDFVGQQAALTTLLEGMRRATQGGAVAAISGVRGMGGIGKTELAYLVANRLTDAFPDAQIVVRLRGTSATPLPPAQAVQQVIHTLTPNTKLPDDLSSLQAYYHSVLHGRRILIMADDACDASQVRPLLPPAGCGLLVTSRQRFSLPGMMAVDLDPLCAEEAVTLLRGLCEGLDEADARMLARVCGYLPLALRISGSVLHNNPALYAASYLARLADERQRLALLHDPDDTQLDVAATLALSYAQLDTASQQVFRQIGVLAADFTTSLAMACVAAGTGADVEAALHRLLRRNLITYDAGRARWRLHDLVRDLARRMSEATEERKAVMWRYARAAVQIAQETQAQYLSGGAGVLAALERFDIDRPHIDAARLWASAHAGTRAGDMLLVADARATDNIGALRYDRRGERLPQLERALAAAQRLADRQGEAFVRNQIGGVYLELGDPLRAIASFEQQLASAWAIDDWSGEGCALVNTGSAYADHPSDRRASACHRQAPTIACEVGGRRCEVGDRRIEAITLSNLGMAYADLGEAQRAIARYEQALTIAREMGNQHVEAITLDNLGAIYLDLEHPLRAFALIEHALWIHRTLGGRLDEGTTLPNLGRAYLALGNAQRAIEHGRQALAILRQIGAQRQEAYALHALGAGYAALGDHEDAQTAFEAALALFRAVGDRRGEAACGWAFGLALGGWGERAGALPLLHAALAYEQEIGHARAVEHAELLARIEAGAEIR
jgi:tetratricopeptide (TPR) repeat protein/transcriptional regulator with XRE-family HTH domain